MKAFYIVGKIEVGLAGDPPRGAPPEGGGVPGPLGAPPEGWWAGQLWLRRYGKIRVSVSTGDDQGLPLMKSNTYLIIPNTVPNDNT